jgi:polyisoprenoid-binding protein YceI
MSVETTAPAFAELTGTWNIDPAHSRIGFVARHAMVTKVRGAFNEFTGSAVIDPANLLKSSAQVKIKATSIDTRNEQRDAHLRGNDFLAMDEYPEITFASTGVEVTGSNTFDLTGDLTVRGVTKPITIPFSFEGFAKDPSATSAPASKAPSSSAAATSRSPGTPPSRPVASWSATRSP